MESEIEPSRHRFIETSRHRNELLLIVTTVILYTLGVTTRNIPLLAISASLALIEKYICYSTVVSDLSNKYQVHLFDLFSAYATHFLIFNSAVNILLIADPVANYQITNPTDNYSDSVNYTLTILSTQGFGDMIPLTRASKFLQSFQTIDSIFLTLTLGTYILTSFVGKQKF